MSCRYLAPALGLLAFTSTASAIDVGGGVTLNGYVDTWLTVLDADGADDISIDFTGEAFAGM